MEEMKLLIVEDSEGDLETFNYSVEVYVQERGCQVKVIQCKNLEEARNKIDPTFDGAIIDLKLGEEGGEGNQVINELEQARFRIPVIILTGTPEAVEGDYPVIAVFTKGEVSYKEILDIFFAIQTTGLTRIMGGRGRIEDVLYKVFGKNLVPHYKKWTADTSYGSWVKYGQEDSARAERALLRHTLYHLLELIEEEDVDECYPEEVYIYPPISAFLKPGSIVKDVATKVLYIVMTPACDLVIRVDQKPKTDDILLVEIESIKSVSQGALDNVVKDSKKVKKLEELAKNNYRNYYHWLPMLDTFQGGL